MEKKIVVVGAGWSGAVIAREIAEKLGREVYVAERRGHIAGNMYDEYDEHGILVQKYGTHTLYSNDYGTFEYVLRFCELYDSPITSKCFVDGRYINSPYNFKTMIDLIGLKEAAVIITKMRQQYGAQKSVSMFDLLASDDESVRQFAELLFEKVYRNYVATMWGKKPEEIDRSVIDRTQFLLDFNILKGLDFNYNPIGGYTKLFEKILCHPNIKLQTNTDALVHIVIDDKTKQVLYDGEAIECLVYTGPIDELFDCRLGALPYRTLDIHYAYFETDSKLPTATVYYPQGQGYMRSNEFRKMMLDDSKCVGTVVSTEYPLDYNRYAKIGNEPYYPVLTKDSQELYAKYKGLAARYKGLYCVGRLAEFKYIDMYKAIDNALNRYEEIERYLQNN